MSENNVEMAKLDELIPRYYKGYDMNDLLARLLNKEPLTKEEDDIIGEAIDIYHTKYFEETQKKWDDFKDNWKKEHPDERIIKSICPQRRDKGAGRWLFNDKI